MKEKELEKGEDMEGPDFDDQDDNNKTYHEQ